MAVGQMPLDVPPPTPPPARKPIGSGKGELTVSEGEGDSLVNCLVVKGGDWQVVFDKDLGEGGSTHRQGGHELQDGRRGL